MGKIIGILVLFVAFVLVYGMARRRRRRNDRD